MENEKSGAKGRPTAETKILVCQCQSTAFELKRQNKTSVVLECAKCGVRMSVKGAVATARVGAQEVSYAVTSTLLTPETGAETGEGGAGDGSDKQPELGPDGEPYRTLRFRLTESAYATFRRACEGIRVVNMRQEQYRAQDWQGHAVEYMAADVIAGLPPASLEVVAAMDEAAARDQAAAEADGKKWTKRKERDIRTKVREEVAVKLGVVESEEYKPPEDPIVQEAKAHEKERAKERKEDDNDPRVQDRDRLRKAVSISVNEYVSETEECEAGSIRIYERLHVAEDYWDSNGGILLKVTGDDRTRSSIGRTPEVYIWMADDDTPEIPLSYAEEFEDDIPDAAVSITEILPSGYYELPLAERWEEATLADTREEVHDKKED